MSEARSVHEEQESWSSPSPSEMYQTQLGVFTNSIRATAPNQVFSKSIQCPQLRFTWSWFTSGPGPVTVPGLWSENTADFTFKESGIQLLPWLSDKG